MRKINTGSMTVISKWIGAVMVLLLALILLCFLVLHRERVYASKTFELVAANDSLKILNSYLSEELEKMRLELQSDEKKPTLQQSQTSSN